MCLLFFIPYFYSRFLSKLFRSHFWPSFPIRFFFPPRLSTSSLHLVPPPPLSTSYLHFFYPPHGGTRC